MLRDYSSKVARLGELGEGFAALIHHIETNGSKPALLEWLKELRPDEVSDLFAIPGAVNDYMAAIKEGNTVFPAPTISEGTLRFIALAAAFFQPSMPKVLVIEEIEKACTPAVCASCSNSCARNPRGQGHRFLPPLTRLLTGLAHRRRPQNHLRLHPRRRFRSHEDALSCEIPALRN